MISGVLVYSEVQGVIEAIVHTEATRYTALLPNMNREDVEQEIRLECLRVMSQFDSTRIGDSPYKFFQTCIRNKFYNMRRGIYVPNNPPCSRCHFWNKSTRSCLIEEEGCDKIVTYRKNMAIKASLNAPAAIEACSPSNLQGSIDNGVDFMLDDLIREALPKELTKSYSMLKSGLSHLVTQSHKTKIRKIVRGILEDG